MPAVYANPVVRKRLIEFLGGDTLGHATAVYISQSDGCRFDPCMLRPPAGIEHFLSRDLDIARSLADTASLLFHLDVEYVNFDSPGEAFLNPARSFELQEPVVRVIEGCADRFGRQSWVGGERVAAADAPSRFASIRKPAPHGLSQRGHSPIGEKLH